MLTPEFGENGQWAPLPSVASDKYSTNRFYVWLAVDCEAVKHDAAPRDPEESIDIHTGISAETLRAKLKAKS